MATDDRSPVPSGRTTPSKPTWFRLRFGLRTLMALPVLAAALIVAYMAIDRWTAVPWSGLPQHGPVIYKVRDATTGQPVIGARVRLIGSRDQVVTDMVTSSGQIRRFGGRAKGTGYRSLVRDMRRVDLGHMGLLVTAEGYEDFAVSASDGPLVARPAPDEKSVEYVIMLRREGHDD